MQTGITKVSVILQDQLRAVFNDSLFSHRTMCTGTRPQAV